MQQRYGQCRTHLFSSSRTRFFALSETSFQALLPKSGSSVRIDFQICMHGNTHMAHRMIAL